MSAEWGSRLLILARGAQPRETSGTHVTTRNRNPGYVSEKPVVTPVTPVMSLKGALANEGQTDDVTNGVTIPDGPSERAAIIEFEAGVPSAWADGFAGLDRQRPLAGYSEMQWRQIIDDAGRFLDCWGAQAASLAWDVADVFGLDPRAPRNRYDAMGLVFLIGGGRVSALDERSATIQRGRSTLTYTRCIGAGACVWELDRPAVGAA